MNFSSRSITATLLVLIVIALGYFVVKPKYEDYSMARTEVNAAKEQQDKLKIAQQQLSDFLKQYQDHASAAVALNQALPLSKTEMANVLNNLDTITKSSGITLGQLSIVDTPGSDQLGAVANAIQSIDLSVNGSGSFDSFKILLSKLENNLRIMDIGSISLQQGPNNGDIQFSMSFKTYYQQ